MARTKNKGPIQVDVNAEEFSAALAAWPTIIGDKVVRVLDLTEEMAFQEIQTKTPFLTGTAQNSWQRVKFGEYSRGIISVLVYIRRLEVGWGKKRYHLGQKPWKMPLGGYAMVRATAKLVPGFIQQAAARVVESSKLVGLAQRALSK